MDKKRVQRIQQVKNAMAQMDSIESKNNTEELISILFKDYEPFEIMFKKIATEFTFVLSKFYYSSNIDDLDTSVLTERNTIILRLFEKTIKETTYSETTFDILQEGLTQLLRFVYQFSLNLREINSARIVESFGEYEIYTESIILKNLLPEFEKHIDRWKLENESYKKNDSTSFDIERLEWQGTTTQFVELFDCLAKKGYFEIPLPSGYTGLIRRLQKTFIILNKEGHEYRPSELANRFSQGRNAELFLKYDNIPNAEKRKNKKGNP